MASGPRKTPSSDAPSPHEITLGHLGARLATVRDARWKMHVLAAPDPRNKLPEPGQRWIDPRAPDGVTMLAHFERYPPREYSGLTTGIAPAAMQLYDLEADPREQYDVAADHSEIVARLRKRSRDSRRPGIS